jgi:transcriptional regulator with XRE-family HTH domain
MESSEILLAYHSLFRKCFIENCELDDDAVTADEQQALDELDSAEVYENCSDLVNGLIKFKRQYRSTTQAELVKKCDTFETMIQKLENDVRNHIAVENQLKLLLENFQSKLQILENTNIELNKKIGNQEQVVKELNGKIDEMKRRNSKGFKGNEEKKEMNGKKKEERIGHKRIKSEFEGLNEIYTSRGQIMRAIKIDSLFAKSSKMLNRKLKAFPKQNELTDRGKNQKIERKQKVSKGKHVRSSSDMLAVIKTKP